MAVDIEFARDLILHKNGHDDFRSGFEGTREIAGILADIIDDDGFPAGGGRATDALIEGDASVRSHGADEGIENQHGWMSAGFEHIKSNPVVFEHALMQELADGLHEDFGRRHGLCDGGNFLAHFLDSGSGWH